MSDALNLEPGALVGGYTLMSRLGSGAMGSVWRVHDDGGEEYAMKILRDSLADDRSTASARDQITARERLRREAMALKKVNHPGVCGIVDMELDDSLAFIVTELIEGKNLRDDVAANGTYVADDLERLASKLMDAVKAVHAAGIVHRDIKPTNVMVSATGPVLVDFGIAMGEGESHVTRTGLVMGTPGFIAPEIIEGTESDEITDWWSVSSVLAFAATGEPVFGTKPMMAVLEREASGNANLTGLPVTTMTAFRAALNPDRSKRCTPEQLLQAITVDAFNPGAWQQYDDDAAQSGQTDVMRPFEHTGLRNPRLLWHPHEPAGSGEKPTAAVTKAGMPRQTAMPGVRPALQRIIGQSAPSPYATVPPIPRLPNASQAADAASTSLRRLPSIGAGADAGTSDGTVPLRGAPLPGNIASSQAPGNDRTAPMSRLTPPMPPTMPVGTEATESLRPQPTSVLPASTMPFDSTVSVGRTMPVQPQPTTALPTDDADMTGATAVIEPSSSADTAATMAMDDPVWSGRPQIPTMTMPPLSPQQIFADPDEAATPTTAMQPGQPAQLQPAAQFQPSMQAMPTAQAMPPMAMNPADIKRQTYLRQGTPLLAAWAAPIAAMAASMPLAAMVAATLLCWLLLTIGYSTDAQLQREYRRGGTHSAGDTAMRIITLPWHALRGLPAAIGRGLLAVATLALGSTLATLIFSLPVVNTRFAIGGITIVVPIIAASPVSPSGLALSICAAISWIIGMLAPAPTMLRLGTGTLLGLNRPAGSSGAGMLPESSDNETAPAISAQHSGREFAVWIAWAVITLSACTLLGLGQGINWWPLPSNVA